jgi:hypothetical protein
LFFLSWTRISLRLLPVVEQLYCGYCENATTRRTPSCSAGSGVELANHLIRAQPGLTAWTRPRHSAWQDSEHPPFSFGRGPRLSADGRTGTQDMAYGVLQMYSGQSDMRRSSIWPQDAAIETKTMRPTDNKGRKGGACSKCLRTCLGRYLVQYLAHALALYFSPHADGRPTANLAVLILNLGCASATTMRGSKLMAYILQLLS